MATPQGKDEFIDYCLRKLGAPVIEINISPQQADDRADEAIRFWRDYHYAGSNQEFMAIRVTARDVARGYLEVPENLLGVVRIIDTTSVAGGGTILDPSYQFLMNQVQNVATGGGLSDYYIARQNLALIRELLIGRPSIRYNRNKNRVYIDSRTFTEGRIFVLEVWTGIDEETDVDMWNDRWLQNYATALMGAQWGRNITKFVNVQLMGGVSFNGDQILQMHEDERKKLEDEVINSFGPGLSYYLG